MKKSQKTLYQIVHKRSYKSIHFDNLRKLLSALGFKERIKGSHHIWTRPDIVEIINIQAQSGMAKPYQVRQIRTIILKYQLVLRDG